MKKLKPNVDLTEKDVLKIADYVSEYLPEIKGFHEQILHTAIEALNHNTPRYNAWSSFVTGLRKYPQIMPVGDKRFSDYPQLVELTLQTNAEEFAYWFQDHQNDEHVIEQTLLRNLFHCFEHFEQNGGEEKLKVELEAMRQEFEAFELQANTKWLSRFFNGMQTSFFEVFAVENVFPKI